MSSIRPYPSVDRIARLEEVGPFMETYGRAEVIDAIRAVLDDHRARRNEPGAELPDAARIVEQLGDRLRERSIPSLRRMFNLTGTVLHTNLGRALLCEAAIGHAGMAMREACNLEFDLEEGGRGERDRLIEGLLTELTGAESATVVNNNAAAVLLSLAALAQERDVVLSRGELIEIGGSFRIPDVMRCAGVRLVEVGTTNRTHLGDYRHAIGPTTAALMKVHTSNYRLTGFVAAVPERELAELARSHSLPLIVDLGAGSLIDLTVHDLPREPVVRDVIDAGADVVTFSGDKLLGGPQAGLIVGKKQYIERIRRHPLKRALRVAKYTLAALEATLLLYRRPEHLSRELPTLRLLTRPVAEIEALARRIQPLLAAALGRDWNVVVAPASSQAGSGSLPGDVIPSIALAITPAGSRSGSLLNQLVRRFAALPVPVIGRVADDAVVLDLRCLEDESGFTAQLDHLSQHQS